MKTIERSSQDVMQVCRNGHVITDLLQTYPERGLAHCDRCGATTLDRCPTCGHSLLGATHVPGMVPLGTLAAPECCASCGAAFPWSKKLTRPAAVDALAALETLLRRLPHTIRQLRTRQGNRPPFRVEDECDLEDLLRAVLPLQFDHVRTESRTPAYAAFTRTDFRLGNEEGVFATALTAKVMSRATTGDRLLEQWRVDVTCYQGQRDIRTLVGLVYDPEGLLREPRQLEAAWARASEELRLRCVIAT
jgi:hypothetical protein